MKNLQIISTPSRGRRNAREMFSLVELWLESDLTQAEFCRAHGLSVSVLSYWLRKYRDEQSGSEKMGSFVALSVGEADRKGVAVIFPNGVKVEISGGSARFIRELAGQC
jgi:hypothetical protein